jgi:hypothetical protein
MIPANGQKWMSKTVSIEIKEGKTVSIEIKEGKTWWLKGS